MGKVMVTGASGFVGSALIPKLIARGNIVYALSRHPPKPAENLIPLEGDITLPNLGLKEVPKGIRSLFHLAAIHRLGADEDGSIWKTNVDGTRNVIDFCLRHNIPHLFFCSTAYTQGRNSYERSKAFCESMVSESSIPKVTIFKPSIIMGTKENFYPGHFSQFVALLIKIHRRAETIRQKLEGKLRLPVLRPVFRIKGNPDSKLNLIPVDAVVNAMVKTKGAGVFWLTNRNPPTLKELAEWIAKEIMVDIRIVPDFKPTPIEAQFTKLAIAFNPYLGGDDLPSNLKRCQPAIDKKFIQWTVLSTLKKLTGLGEM